MSTMNTVNLLNQIRTMSSLVEGSKVELAPKEAPFNTFLQQAFSQLNDLSQTADSLKTQFDLLQMCHLIMNFKYLSFSK